MTPRLPAALRFLGLLVMLWVGARTVVLTAPHWRTSAAPELSQGNAPAPLPVRQPAPRPIAAISTPSTVEASAPPQSSRRQLPVTVARSIPPDTPAATTAPIAPAPIATADTPAPPPAAGGIAAEAAYAALRAGDRRAADAAFTRARALAPDDPRAPGWRLDQASLNRHWSGAAYALIGRDDGDLGLAARPQLGGAQAGARLAYRLDPLSSSPIDVVARVHAPLADGRATRRGAQAAIGLEWRPALRLPAAIAVERTVAIGEDGRDSFAIRASGGVHERPVGPFLLSAYGEAGIVGFRQRDPFIDTSARVGGAVPMAGAVALKPALGIWGAAQPGARRFDAGPSLTAAAPAGGLVIAADLDWRFRIAGNARPASGPALTVRAGF